MFTQQLLLHREYQWLPVHMEAGIQSVVTLVYKPDCHRWPGHTRSHLQSGPTIQPKNYPKAFTLSPQASRLENKQHSLRVLVQVGDDTVVLLLQPARHMVQVLRDLCKQTQGLRCAGRKSISPQSGNVWRLANLSLLHQSLTFGCIEAICVHQELLLK